MNKKKTKLPVVFGTTDVFGNLVRLQVSTWNEHILIEHPEMAGCETLIEALLKDPLYVLKSTQHDTGAGFVSDPGIGPRPEGLRAIVNYADMLFQKGATTGLIVTAYPIDIANFRSPRLGRAVYKRGGQT